MNFLWVALGSAFGGTCRYAISLALKPQCGFPWATFAVNVAGSFAIGALSGWFAHCPGGAAAWRAFAVAGVCGGFTTFSTFSNEVFRMAEAAQWGTFAAYVASSLVAGLAATWLGYAAVRCLVYSQP